MPARYQGLFQDSIGFANRLQADKMDLIRGQSECDRLCVLQASDVARESQFSYDYQAVRWLDMPVTMHSGDLIFASCQYDSSERSGPTPGGFASSQEMCINFLLFTPASCSALLLLSTWRLGQHDP
jgi:Copper type II ascorbate-dependent monooxygenase, C-terminal domain